MSRSNSQASWTGRSSSRASLSGIPFDGPQFLYNARMKRMPSRNESRLALTEDEPVSSVTTHPGPHLDVLESHKKIVVLLEVPGAAREDLDVNITGEYLRITGTLPAAKNVAPIKNGVVLRTERRVGQFNRKVRIPDDYSVEKARASLEAGILRIDIPKAVKETHIAHLDIA